MSLSRVAPIAATFSLIAAVTPASARQQQQPSPAPQQGPASPQTSAPRPAAPTLPRPEKLPAGVVARVNGTNVTFAQLSNKLKAWAGRPLLERAVQELVIEQEAKKYGVSVTSAELAAEIAKAKQSEIDRIKQGGGGMMTWREIAERSGISEAFVSDSIRSNVLARKTFRKVIEKNIPSIDGQIKVAHILIANMDLTPPAPNAKPKTPEEEAKRDADAKAKAEQLIKDIAAKKISFEDAAKQFSDDKGPNGQGSAANGGALPFTGKNRWDPAFEKAAFELAKPGDITPTPIKSRFGYHIIKLIQTGNGAPAAEREAYKKEQLDMQMQNPQALGQWLQYLISTAQVSYGVSAPAPAATPKPAPAKKKP